MLKGNVLITGGTGFLGRAILKRANEENWDVQFTIYSRDEHKQVQCKKRWPRTRYIIGDVLDTQHLTAAMSGHDYVIHAAAIKFIPEAEWNVEECIRINIDGARSVIQAALDADVLKVVGISTDKAVQPINIYGMTKAVMEKLFASPAVSHCDTLFNTVRYGNVIGSTGSVIPLFQQQFQETGKVTITHPNMTRFWMTANEAIDLILSAFDAYWDGSVCLPVQMRSMTMWKLAECIASDYEVIGLRPGEKMHEDLLAQHESHRVFESPNGGGYEIIPSWNNTMIRETPVGPIRSNSPGVVDQIGHDEMIGCILEAMDI